MFTPTDIDQSSQNYSPQAQDTPPVYYPPVTPIAAPPTTHIGFILLLTLAMIVATGVAIYFGLENQTLKQATQVSQPSTTTDEVPSQAITNKRVGLVIKKADELWIKTESNPERQVTQTNGQVVKYTQSSTHPLVAYIQGERKVATQTYIYFEPLTVRLKNLETQEDTVIYTLTPTVPTETPTEFVDKVSDVAFSEDGSKLAITTSQSLLIYDVETQKLSQAFHRPFTGHGGSGIFNYSGPVFSPDNSKVFLKFIEYESYYYSIVDLADGSIIETEFDSGFGSIQNVLGWINNDQLLIADGREDIPGQPTHPDLIRYTISNQAVETVIASLPERNYFSSGQRLGNDTFILVDQKTDFQTHKTAYSLFQLNLAARQVSRLANIYESAPQTMPIVTLVSVDVETNAATVVIAQSPTPNQGDAGYIESTYTYDLGTGTLIE